MVNYSSLGVGEKQGSTSNASLPPTPVMRQADRPAEVKLQCLFYGAASPFTRPIGNNAT
jgi:hypothetical protein